MTGAATITLSPSVYPTTKQAPIKVGDKIKASRKTAKHIKRANRLRGKLMVYRMLKKEFSPIFVVTSASNSWNQWNFSLKPFNF